MSEKVPYDEVNREYYTRIMDEAREERAHAQRLAEIQAQKEVDLVKAKQDNWEQREWKRNLIAGILVGSFILAIIAVFWYGIVRVHESDRARLQYQTEQQQKIAQKCIEEGNIWLNQSCLLATKGQ